jgi:hypothetical protein
MGLEQIYRCDVCGRIKGEANKWMGVKIIFGSFTIYLWNRIGPANGGTLDGDLKLVCGELCLHKLLQPFLDSRSQEVGEARAKLVGQCDFPHHLAKASPDRKSLVQDLHAQTEECANWRKAENQ